MDASVARCGKPNRSVTRAALPTTPALVVARPHHSSLRSLEQISALPGFRDTALVSLAAGVRFCEHDAFGTELLPTPFAVAVGIKPPREAHGCTFRFF